MSYLFDFLFVAQHADANAPGAAHDALGIQVLDRPIAHRCLEEQAAVRPRGTEANPLLAIALMTEHPATVSLAGLGWNLLWVTIGNAIAGAGIMGLGYWAASRSSTATAAPVAVSLAAAE